MPFYYVRHSLHLFPIYLKKMLHLIILIKKINKVGFGQLICPCCGYKKY